LGHATNSQKKELKEREILQRAMNFRHCDHRDVDGLTFLVERR